MRKILLLLLLFTCFSCKEEITDENYLNWDWDIVLTNGTNKDCYIKIYGSWITINKEEQIKNINIKKFVQDGAIGTTAIKQYDYSYIWVEQYTSRYGNEIKSKKLTPEDNIFVCE